MTVSIRYVLYINGALLFVLALAMLFPAMIDANNNDPDWVVFVASSMTTLFLAGILVFGYRGSGESFNRRTGYLITVSCWVVTCAVGSLPLIFSSLNVSVTDAVFETMSGLTTTGSTILAGLDTMPRGILMWRSLLNWTGGIGIVAMALVLLPMLRIGGMQLFQTESSDISGKLTPRMSTFAMMILGIYVGLTALCATALYFAGMGVFDAVNHAMTTLATGGFSTKDASVGHFNSPLIEAVIIVFMTAGALPLVFYAHVFFKGWSALAADAQVPTFLAVLAAAILIMTGWNWLANGDAPLYALRISAFNVTSVLTDTGYGSADFSQWGNFAVGFMFLLMLVGGCAGSTSGAIKIFRWQLLLAGVRYHLVHMLTPNRIVPLRYGDRTISAEMLMGVRNFFFLYIVTLGLLSVGLMATGMDFLASFSAVAQAMANAGPGLTKEIGPMGNFANVPDAAKWLLTLAMLLGRLELVTVYVMALRAYWAD